MEESKKSKREKLKSWIKTILIKTKECLIKYLPMFCIGFIIVSFTVNQMLHKIHFYFSFGNYSNVLTVLFGVTSGIVTVIGLIAIYISINTQQNIQKCKEVVWELEELDGEGIHNNEDVKRMAKKIIKKLKLYNDILSKSGNDFNNRIIDLTQWAFLGVSFLWLISINVFLAPEQSLAEYGMVILVVTIGILFLQRFSIIIGELKNVTNLGDLTPTVDLLSFKGILFVRTILAITNIKTVIYRNELYIINKLPTTVDFGVILNEIQVFENNSMILDPSPFPPIREAYIVIERNNIPEGLHINEGYWKNIVKISEKEKFTEDFERALKRIHTPASLPNRSLIKLRTAEEVKYKEGNFLELTKETNILMLHYTLTLFKENQGNDSKQYKKENRIKLNFTESLRIIHDGNSQNICARSLGIELDNFEDLRLIN